MIGKTTTITTGFEPWFKRSEFACRCGCGFDTADVELIHILNKLRAHYGVPIAIYSGARCADHNRKVGGAKNSQHLLGRAADISVHGQDPRSVAATLRAWYPSRYGIGTYPTFTHIDSRGRVARWRK